MGGPSDDTRQRFQGKCLQGLEGSKFMSDFDRLPATVRSRLASSDFNLCAVCVQEIASEIAARKWERDQKERERRRVAFLCEAIEEMEEQIREEQNG